MSIKKLNSIFRPKRIALIGASNDLNSVGGTTLKNLVVGGFNGVVYPVNPKREAVLGIQCYPNVYSLPKIPDLAVITTNAKLVPQLIRECGEVGINGIIIMSAGFREIGEEGKKQEDIIMEEISKFPDMRVIGPNCMGIIVPGLNMNVSFASEVPKKGHVAFISQSGALGASILDWAAEENIGFSNFVSIGNCMDVSFGDLIDYFGQDPRTKTIILYVESITHARHFMTAARAFARKKPIIVYKSGRFPESAAAAESHTGAMASEDSIYDAVFQRAGLARVYNIGDIFDFTDLIARKHIPKGRNLAIITNAGGPGVMATDSLIANRGKCVDLSEETIQRLNEILPSFWSHGNPVDIIGDALPQRYLEATKIVIDDPKVDAILVILTPQAMTKPTETAREIAKLSENTIKPIMAAWLGGKRVREAISVFNDSGIAVYPTPEQAIRAFMTLVEYSRNINSLFETPQELPVSFAYDREKLREEFNKTTFTNKHILSESESKELLDIYGIPTTKPILAKTENEAVKFAEEIGFPVVLKIESPDIIHKFDIGGISLNIKDKNQVQKSYNKILTSISEKNPKAKLQGITVQPMVNTKNGIELILGIKKDAVFGTVILIGMGGIGAEVFKDNVLGFPPLTETLARQMIKKLKIFPLLKGYRGEKSKNIDKLIEVLIRISYLAADYPEIEELDINPILVTDKDVIALDGRVVIDQEIVDKGVEPYSHLLLHPYPEKYITSRKLSNGTDVILRPIRPEDEPMWLELLGSCSKESIYSRFRSNFHFDAHEVATEFCFIDYLREIAIVAEVNVDGSRKLIGVGRLITDFDHESVEYAILITDAWQKKDLGRILTDYCLEIAKNWGLKKIIAETTADNKAMLSVFRKLGFSIHFEVGGSVHVTKDLL
ncbi:MAG: bifunctional acetate--CoA ligase family protein/GNAT family N-acetyltransferase [Bacteroidales bacterium]|nr:bifunctional acetate--CoA ligase family protein/GNAT family N-acetyltransferase [Bacteroidales bacterium]